MQHHPPHWAYYFSLEDDFVETSRYVEICEDNFDTYSIQYVRMILAIGSEVDVVAKEVCRQINASNALGNIDQYRDILVVEKPAMPRLRFGTAWNPLRLQPWQSWGNTPPTNPDWWRAYNTVKHERLSNLSLGNLRNTINALAGLYALMLHLNRPGSYERPEQYLRIEAPAPP
jgi:hypothetical protein